MILRYGEVSIDKEIASYTGISMPLILISLEKMAARNIVDIKFKDFDIHVILDKQSDEIVKDLQMLRNDISEICTRDMNPDEKDQALLLLKKMTENVRDFLK